MTGYSNVVLVEKVEETHAFGNKEYVPFCSTGCL